MLIKPLERLQVHNRLPANVKFKGLDNPLAFAMLLFLVNVLCRPPPVARGRALRRVLPEEGRPCRGLTVLFMDCTI